MEMAITAIVVIVAFFAGLLVGSFRGSYIVKPREYVATKNGIGTCRKCGGSLMGRLPHRDWWECVVCGPDGAGQGNEPPLKDAA